MPELTIGGFLPFSMTDYPGHLAAVIFCQGCPWHCRYCQNPHLQPQSKETSYRWQLVLEFLKRRKELLDAVVFSGGEPTFQENIKDAIEDVRRLGFKVGMHTAGCNPDKLKEIISYLDWVGLDVKAPPVVYAGITKVAGSAAQALSSAAIVLESGVNYEVRTTVHSILLSEIDILDVAHMLVDLGVKHYALQEFNAGDCKDKELIACTESPVSDLLLKNLSNMFESFTIRRACMSIA